ncbi:MAG TPA: MFS transporter [Sphingomicrobium sp.]|nr:MFS transporter [Sphingomicrobium sp.]
MNTTIAVDSAPAPSIGRSMAALLLIAFAIAIGFCTMQSFSIMAESAKAELKLSDYALGFVLGFGSAIPMVLFSVPIGVLVDRHNRVRLLIALAAVWTLGTIVTAVSPNATILFIGRMLTGIGTTGALTAVLSLSADLCLPDQRGRGMLISTLGKTVGMAAGFAVTGALMTAFAAPDGPRWFGDVSAWRAAQWTLGVGSAIAILPLFLLREPPRHEVEAGPDAPFRQVMAELWLRRAFLIPLFVGQTSVVMADAAAGIWAAPVLERVFHLKPGDFGGWLGGIILFTGLFGAILGGLVADWGQKSGRRGGLLIGAVAAAIIGTPAALFPVMPTVPAFAVLIGVLILAGTVTGLVTSVALTVMLPNELRGLSIGLFIAIAGLVGFGIAPMLVTVVSTILGGEQHIAPALAIVGTIVSFVAVIAFWLAMRRAPAAVAEEAAKPI